MEKWRYVCQLIKQGLLKATGATTVEEAVDKLREGKEKIGLARKAAQAYTDLLTAVTTNDDGVKEKLLKDYSMQLIEEALSAMRVPSVYIQAAKIGWQIGSPYGQYIAEKILVIENSVALRDAVTCTCTMGYMNDTVFLSSDTGRIFWYREGNYYVLRNRESSHFFERGLQFVGLAGYDKEWVQIKKE
jgi:hypothetical protein